MMNRHTFRFSDMVESVSCAEWSVCVLVWCVGGIYVYGREHIFVHLYNCTQEHMMIPSSLNKDSYVKPVYN